MFRDFFCSSFHVGVFRMADWLNTAWHSRLWLQNQILVLWLFCSAKKGSIFCVPSPEAIMATRIAATEYTSNRNKLAVTHVYYTYVHAYCLAVVLTATFVTGLGMCHQLPIEVGVVIAVWEEEVNRRRHLVPSLELPSNIYRFFSIPAHLEKRAENQTYLILHLRCASSVYHPHAYHLLFGCSLLNMNTRNQLRSWRRFTIVGISAVTILHLFLVLK